MFERRQQIATQLYPIFIPSLTLRQRTKAQFLISNKNSIFSLMSKVQYAVRNCYSLVIRLPAKPALVLMGSQKPLDLHLKLIHSNSIFCL